MGIEKCDHCAAALLQAGKPTKERLHASDRWHLRMHDGGSATGSFTLRKGQLSVWVGIPASGDPRAAEYDTLITWHGEVQPDDTTGEIVIAMRRHHGGGRKPAMLTAEVTADGLLKGQMVQPAFASLTGSGGRRPRKSLPSYFFTGYPVCLGYGTVRLADGTAGGPSGHTQVSEQHASWVTVSNKNGKWGDAFCGEPVAPLTDRPHERAAVEAAEKARAETEEAARDELRTRAGLPFEFEVRQSSWDGVPVGVDPGDPAYKVTPPDFDSGDEAHYKRSCGEDDETEASGADYSGRGGGFRCRICNRRSENVGPRRGFDYRISMCGGCGELDEMSAEDAARPVPPEKQIY